MQLRNYLLALLISAFICSVLTALHSHTPVKQMISAGCTCVMLITLLSPLTVDTLDSRFSFSSYISDFEEALLSANKKSDSYTARVMEQEYEAYIISRANDQSIIIHSADVECRKTNDGLWIPFSVSYESRTPITASFKQEVEQTLGIPMERQIEDEAAISEQTAKGAN